jgi:hypothetical protein
MGIRRGFARLSYMKTTFLFGIATFLFTLAGCKTPEPLGKPQEFAPKIVSVERIWDAAGHNAFTDLIRFRNQWFCTFRESESHVGGEGRIRVLTSADGRRWTTAALLTEPGVDLRDPKFSITPDRRLMLVLGGTYLEGKSKAMQPRVTFSSDGSHWSATVRILERDDWLWRVTWYKNQSYGIAYTVPSRNKAGPEPVPWSVRLVTAPDGLHFRTLAPLNIPDRPNEGTLRFAENGDCIALVRREAGDKAAWIGRSHLPYTTWQWKSADLFIGGPNFIRLPDGSMVAAGREIDPATRSPKTFLGSMSLDSVVPQLTLPSGGDCSYPGLVFHQGLLWMTYYSSHEGKASIYLAKIKL